MINETNPDRPTEGQIPAYAKTATGRAYKSALTSGHRVLVAKDGKVWQVQKDGSKRVVSKTASPTNVTVGEKRTVRK